MASTKDVTLFPPSPPPKDEVLEAKMIAVDLGIGALRMGAPPQVPSV